MMDAETLFSIGLWFAGVVGGIAVFGACVLLAALKLDQRHHSRGN